MSLLLERLAEQGSAPLEGYGHQVGGHFLLMKFEDAAICKPLIQREHYFYETLPEDLKLFLPAYYGVVKVGFERQLSGDIQMVAYSDENRSHGQTEPASCRTTKIDNYSLKASTGRSIHDGETSILSKGVDGGDSYVNPWSKECAKNTTEKLKQFGNQLEGLHQDYVVLENLTSKFTSPSILDLKVGTRQHGDDVPEAKMRKHMKTVAESTSSTLGVRICGMQKFDASKNEYLFRDKYYGRSLDDEGFYQELRAFLHNGVCFRSDLIPNLLSMVQELRKVIERQCSYRFYSSSLLIIYDGAAVTPELTSNKERAASWWGDVIGRGDPGLIKLNEAARSNGEGDVEGELGLQQQQHRDGDSLERNGRISEIDNGAPNLTDKGDCTSSCACRGVPGHEGGRTFESSDLLHVNPTAPFRSMLHHNHNHRSCDGRSPLLLLSETTPTDPTPPPNSSADKHRYDTCRCHSDHKPHPPPTTQSREQKAKFLTRGGGTPPLNHHTTGKNGYHKNSGHHSHQASEMLRISKTDFETARKSIDLRMIDFAHSTHRGYNDRVVYSGPDEGYVLGVSSLVACLQRMLSESS